MGRDVHYSFAYGISSKSLLPHIGRKTEMRTKGIMITEALLTLLFH